MRVCVCGGRCACARESARLRERERESERETKGAVHTHTHTRLEHYTSADLALWRVLLHEPAEAVVGHVDARLFCWGCCGLLLCVRLVVGVG